MEEGGFSTLRVYVICRCRQVMVSAAFVSAAFGVLPFRISHSGAKVQKSLVVFPREVGMHMRGAVCIRATCAHSPSGDAQPNVIIQGLREVYGIFSWS